MHRVNMIWGELLDLILKEKKKKMFLVTTTLLPLSFLELQRQVKSTASFRLMKGVSRIRSLSKQMVFLFLGSLFFFFL